MLAAQKPQCCPMPMVGLLLFCSRETAPPNLLITTLSRQKKTSHPKHSPDTRGPGARRTSNKCLLTPGYGVSHP